MLPKQQQLMLSIYNGIYDVVIKKDHKLRKLHDLLDYEFIYDELKDKYCDDNGAMAYNPVMMFKLLILKVEYKLSDRDLMERGETDLAIKYFLDLSPEATMPHPSLLTKFRKLRLNDEGVLNRLLEKTITVAQEKGLIKSKTIIVDSTHTKSVYNPMTPIEILQEESKKLRKTVYSIDESYKGKMPIKPLSKDLDDHIKYCKELITLLEKDEVLQFNESIKEKTNYLKEIVEDDIENRICLADEEAKIGHKTVDTSFFGYKTHIAMCPERLITAAIVTSGDKSDSVYTKDLIEQSKINGYEVETLIGDGAYSSKSDLEYGKNNDIKIVSKLNTNVYLGCDHNRKCRGFTFNKDAGMYVCTAGHMAIRKVSNGGKKDAKKRKMYTYHFDINKCKSCPLRDGCYKEGAKSKTYTYVIPSNIHQEQLEFQNTVEFKSLYKERYKIEAKNNELKNNHGLKTTYASGLFSMQLQSIMTIFTVNLKRMITLEKEMKEMK